MIDWDKELLVDTGKEGYQLASSIDAEKCRDILYKMDKEEIERGLNHSFESFIVDIVHDCVGNDSSFRIISISDIHRRVRKIHKVPMKDHISYLIKRFREKGFKAYKIPFFNSIYVSWSK